MGDRMEAETKGIRVPAIGTVIVAYGERWKVWDLHDYDDQGRQISDPMVFLLGVDWAGEVTGKRRRIVRASDLDLSASETGRSGTGGPRGRMLRQKKPRKRL